MGGFGMATGPASGMRFAQTRGRIQGSPVQGVNYPSPFFDLAHTYLPVTVKALFKWCRYYFLTNPLINAVTFKLSEYPITDVIIDHEDEQVKKRWTEYFQDHLGIRGYQVETGLDYHCYGNNCSSIGYPFKKWLRCSKCDFKDVASKIRQHWIFTSNQFRLTCPKCGYVGDAIAKDEYIKNASGIKMIRWNPEDIEITYNDITGEYTYFYTIPATVRNDIVIGRKDIVEGVPQVFIQAMREQKGVIFSKDNFFHMRRPTLATQDRGWGTPLLLPVLKDTFYLQVMKKAQEAILLEHIVPLRTMFPQAGSGSTDPYCVSPDTLVETSTGLVPAEEIHAGDVLRSHTGAWRRVEYQKRRQVKYGEKVFRFKIASLSAFPFKLSEEHPILAVPRASNKKPREGLLSETFIEAKALRRGDYVAYPIRRQVRSGQMLDLGEYLPGRAVTEQWVYRRLSQGAAEIYEWLESTNDPKHAWGERRKLLEDRGWSEADYETAAAMRGERKIDRVRRFLPMCPALGALIGYYLAEGSYGDSVVSFSLNLAERDIAETIETIVRNLGFRGVSHYERPEQHGRVVVIEDVLLSELLVSLCGEGFVTKRIPDIVSEGTDAIVISTLNALFLGDGCDFKTTTDRVGLKLANPSLIMETRRLLLSFGLIGGVVREEPTESTKFRTTSYQLNYNGHVAEKLRHLFGRPGGVDWKDLPQKSGIVRGDYVLLRIDEVEEVADVPEVIGFQMSDDKSFCVAGVATHNTTVNLVDWRDQIAMEIARWRFDNNYIPILPLPIGTQTIGGDGRNLLLTQEIQAWSDQILNGMGVPVEFIRGGMQYAGTNVSMRMMENSFIGYILRLKAQARFIMRQIAAFMDWPVANIRFKPFKMADDLQRKAFLFQLNQANKVSDTTLLADSDLDQNEENQIMIRETDTRLEATKKQQLAMAQIQGEQQLIMMKFQAKGQQVAAQAQQAPVAPGEPGGAEQQQAGGSPGGSEAQPGVGVPQEAQPQQAMPPTPAAGAQQAAGGAGAAAAPAQGGAPQNFLSQVSSQLTGKNRLQQGQAGIDLPGMAMAHARLISVLPKAQQEMALQNLDLQSPELGQLVRQMLASMTPEQEGGGTTDMRPLPNQLPPRRAAGTI
jgi:hypothetical protein